LVAFVVVASRETLDESDEHADDPLQAFFAWANLLDCHFSLGDQGIQAGGTLECRTVRDIEESTTILSLPRY
jgi:hypothetical protein